MKKTILKFFFKNKRLCIFFLIAVTTCFLAAGCATTPSSLKFPYETIYLNNSAYFAIIDMCDHEGVKWDYDPLSKEILLKKDAVELRLLVGSRDVMVGSMLEKLPAPVEIRESVLYAPLELRNYFAPVSGPTLLKNLSPAGILLRPVDIVIIDAGHGGRDPGAIGRYGLKEKTVVLDIAEKVTQGLKSYGLKVSMTRDDDEYIPLLQRPNIANKKNADLFISIHANANHSRWIEGVEVYYLTEAVDDNARALVAAENYPLEVAGQDVRGPISLKATLWDMVYTENRKESVSLARYVSDAVSKKMNLKELGVKGAPFIVLKGARMPAVLVEIGYISNREGEKKLEDPVYRHQMADAIVEGIINFKNYAEGRV